ncbi:MAG: glycosyltransferase [Chitinophagaceae bacterium]
MEPIEKNMITVIIPVYNEYESIPYLVQRLNEFFGQHKHLNPEVIFVDDGSADQSPLRLAEMRHHTYIAKMISFSRNYGTHAALRAGILHAKGEYITFLYADMQDPIENVINMYEKALAGNDIVWAHRASEQSSFFERQFSKFYSRLMQKYVNRQYPTKGFDVILFNRKVAAVINNNIEANSSIFLQVLNMGFCQDYIEYQKLARQTGKSKWTIGKKIKLFIDSFVAFSYAPIRFVTIVGITFFIVGVLWTTYIVIRKIFFQDLAAGWPALISILMIGFGITNISLGIIAEYLWRTLDASRKRPVFIIDEIKELDKT